ncbi:MAG: 1-acyl-sn-glycerol-3-phosphate acyltransferase [Tessaracoccus sp.]|uniref:lysophospholipid acyltransferase family protein n=1 Tax=Tessaracoccus sp. TaxID=1971211 RepID=UPI001ECFE079|nr:lysophospholipid acyltransferase family protein [Tessaracoccus sp.]MBK7821410.1 1-acyl-sn-glycerol-3-phosphate acyltransferase [Tessaracoccus sp.]
MQKRDEKPWRRRRRDVNREPAPVVYRALVRLVRVFIPLVARRHWAGQEHIPATGPAIVVGNHISNFDPIVLGEYLVYSGRWPRFLGKADIWRVPVLGWVARQCQQIPVYRDTDRASDSLIHARKALERGQLIALYPEGTITADPDGWPMTGRRGAAQLALRTGAPVVPVAQDGAQLVLGGKRIEWRRLFGPRRDIRVEAGPPIDLSDFDGAEPTKEVLDKMTERILDTLTGMRAELTGLTPPEDRYDARRGARVPRGRAIGE